jgi:hypothetical protein
MQFGLKTGNEIARPVLEKDDKAKGEKDEKKKPKKTADETHARRLADWFRAVNDLETSFPDSLCGRQGRARQIAPGMLR